MTLNNSSDLEVKKLRAALAKYEDQNKNLNIQIDKLTRAVADGERDVQLSKDEAKRTRDGVSDEINQISAELKKSKANEALQEDSINQLKDALRVANTEIDATKLMVKNDRSGVEFVEKELRRKDVEIQKAQELLRDCQIEREKLDNAVLVRVKECERLNKQLDSLKAEKLTSTRSAEELELQNQQVRRELEVATGKIKELEEVTAKCRDVLFSDSETDMIFERMRATKTQNRLLKVENLRLTDCNEQLDAERLTIDGKIHELTCENTRVNDENQYLTNKIASIESEVHEAKEKVAMTELKLGEALTLQEINASLKSRIVSLGAAKEESDRKIGAFKRLKEKMEQDIYRLTMGAKQSGSKINQLAGDLELFKLSNEELTREKNNLEDANVKKLREMTELMIEVKKYKDVLCDI